MHNLPQPTAKVYKSVKPADLEAGKLFLMPPTQWSYAFFVKRRIIEQWQGWETLEDYGLVQVNTYNAPYVSEEDFFLVVDACCLIRKVQGLHVVGLWNDRLVAIPRDRVGTHIFHVEDKVSIETAAAAKEPTPW